MESSSFARNTSNDPVIGCKTRLASAHRSVTFPVKALTTILDGGPELHLMKTRLRSELTTFVSSCVTAEAQISSIRERTLYRVRRAFEWLMSDADDVTSRSARVELLGIWDMNWFIRNGVHYGLFLNALTSNASYDQLTEYMPQALLLQIYGCFAMTELGHGSNVREIETTATLCCDDDSSSHYFILNTPTDTATKWWIGAAADTATHAIVFAQLVIQKKSAGVFPFIVQLRCLDTHNVLSGITIGDCGAKLGLNGVDNGWIQFDSKRLDYNQLLSRNVVSLTMQDGIVLSSKKNSFSAALVSTRGDLVLYAANLMKKALVIAIRYSVIRLQGWGGNKTSPEASLLSYKTHQSRLFPLLAQCYAFHFQVLAVRKLLVRLEEEESPRLLEDVHATTAGLKAVATWAGLDTIETCRQCCGGQGYGSNNGFATLSNDFAVMVTWEGDNTVMALSTARYVVSTFVARRKNSSFEIPANSTVSYLESCNKQWPLLSKEDVYDISSLLQACVYSIVTTLQNAPASVNERNIDLVKMHVLYNVAFEFAREVRTATTEESELGVVLLGLVKVFLYHVLLSSEVFACTCPNPVSVRKWIHNACEDISETILLPNAIGLVDAFALTSCQIGSCIGEADGDIYQRLLSSAGQKKNEVPSYYESQIRPLLHQDELNFEKDETSFTQSKL